jgi:hypothetical protein
MIRWIGGGVVSEELGLQVRWVTGISGGEGEGLGCGAGLVDMVGMYLVMI